MVKIHFISSCEKKKGFPHPSQKEKQFGVNESLYIIKLIINGKNSFHQLI